MNKKQFDLLEETLIRRYGKEKAYKILHSNIPEDRFLMGLSKADFEFFVRYFLLPCEVDPCGMLEHYFTNIDRARAVLLLEERQRLHQWRRNRMRSPVLPGIIH